MPAGILDLRPHTMAVAWRAARRVGPQPSLALQVLHRAMHGAAFGIRGGDCDCRMLRILDRHGLVRLGRRRRCGSGFLLFLLQPRTTRCRYSAFMNYTLLSIPISALYPSCDTTAVHSFEMLAWHRRRFFLLLGSIPRLRRPPGMACVGVRHAEPADTGSADMVSFATGMLGQVAGIAAAALFSGLLRSVSAQWTARRLLHIGWRNVANMGETERAPSVMAVSARMLDDRLAHAAARGGWHDHDLNAIMRSATCGSD